MAFASRPATAKLKTPSLEVVQDKQQGLYELAGTPAPRPVSNSFNMTHKALEESLEARLPSPSARQSAATSPPSGRQRSTSPSYSAMQLNANGVILPSANLSKALERASPAGPEQAQPFSQAAGHFVRAPASGQKVIPVMAHSTLRELESASAATASKVGRTASGVRPATAAGGRPSTAATAQRGLRARPASELGSRKTAAGNAPSSKAAGARPTTAVGARASTAGASRISSSAQAKARAVTYVTGGNRPSTAAFSATQKKPGMVSSTGSALKAPVAARNAEVASYRDPVISSLSKGGAPKAKVSALPKDRSSSHSSGTSR